MRDFAAKLLLFGEYSLLQGSKALVLPHTSLQGKWSFGSEIDQRLLAYSDFLKQHDDIIDVEKFVADLKQGLFFETNIPQGYGLGSSGALVAAVYDSYARTKELELKQLRQIFSQLEAYYHGTSSGIDPLVSFVNRGLLLEQNGDLVTLDLKMPDTFFLVDTKIPRQTAPLVQLFLQKSNSGQLDSNQLVTLNNRCIDAFLSDNHLKECFKELSIFQFNYLQEMIPVPYRQHWQRGLDQDLFYLKLCGAGGGGLLLGIGQPLTI